MDVDKGTLGLPPVVGQFTGRRGEFYDPGEFYDQEEYQGSRDPGALRLERHLAEIGSNGAVVLARRRKILGGKLDLRVVSVALRWCTPAAQARSSAA